jgi:hypothetical protein
LRYSPIIVVVGGVGALHLVAGECLGNRYATEPLLPAVVEVLGEAEQVAPTSTQRRLQGFGDGLLAVVGHHPEDACEHP